MSAIRKAPSLAGCRYAALLEKPFDLDEVLQTIVRLLPRHVFINNLEGREHENLLLLASILREPSCYIGDTAR